MTINPSTGAPSAEIGTPLPAGGTGSSFNYGVIDPYGRFIYVSDDVGNTIYGFKIDPATGALTQIGSGAAATTNLDEPEQLIIDRSGTYMYASNFNGNTVSSYSIDQVTGALTPLTTSSGPSIHRERTFLWQIPTTPCRPTRLALRRDHRLRHWHSGRYRHRPVRNGHRCVRRVVNGREQSRQHHLTLHHRVRRLIDGEIAGHCSRRQ